MKKTVAFFSIFLFGCSTAPNSSDCQKFSGNPKEREICAERACSRYAKNPIDNSTDHKIFEICLENVLPEKKLLKKTIDPIDEMKDRVKNNYRESTGEIAKSIEEIKMMPDVISLSCSSFTDLRRYSPSFVTDGKYKALPSKFKSIPIYSGDLSCIVSESLDNRSTNIYLIEKGTLNNVKYRIDHSHAEASVGNDIDEEYSLYKNNSWDILCRKDVINGKKSCLLRHDRLPFSFYKTKSSFSMSAGSNLFPGRGVTIKLDKLSPISTGDSGYFSNGVAQRIFNGLKNNSELFIRYTEWPYDTPLTENIPVQNIETVKKIFQRISGEFLK